jgi:hypothetical protein
MSVIDNLDYLRLIHTRVLADALSKTSNGIKKLKPPTWRLAVVDSLHAVWKPWVTADLKDFILDEDRIGISGPFAPALYPATPVEICSWF